MANIASLFPSLFLWLASKIFTEKLLREVSIILIEQIGSYLVGKTSNKLDDKLLEEVLKALRDDG